MQIRTGTYTGTGVAKSVTNLGITPDFVLVKRENNVSDSFYRMSTMPANTSQPFTSTGSDGNTNQVKDMFANGFNIGTDAAVNANGATYRWLAIEFDDGVDGKTLTWAGNDNNDRSISGAGFTPDLVMLIARTGLLTIWRTSTMIGDQSQSFRTGDTMGADMIQAFEADGFQVGTDIRVNGSGRNYDAICLKNVASKLKVLTYTGDGATGRSVTGAGFRPNFVLLKKATIGDQGVVRYQSHAGALSHKMKTADETNLITAFEADGFEVGSHATVNASGVVYNAVVMDATVSEGGSAMSLPIIIA